MRKQRFALMTAVTLVTVVLAGCAGGNGDVDDASNGGEGRVDSETFRLQAGKGAIAGLLVDDRFRPIHLTDNPDGEFQTTGFVLVQETGQEAKTNANGEFSFVNLEPGTYTLRITAAGHEAIPQRVSVEEGVFNELSVIARRVISQGSLILTEEYSVFVPCVFTAFALAFSPDCTFDESGDTQRFAFYPDYTGIPEITVMITEMKLGSPAGGAVGSWGVSVRDPSAITNGIYYSEGALKEGDYLRLVNVVGEVSEHGGRNTEWNNDVGFQVALFGQGLFQSELNSVTCDLPDPAARCTWGGGVQVGQRATFVQSLILDVPEVDIETYCVIC